MGSYIRVSCVECQGLESRTRVLFHVVLRKTVEG